MFCHSCKSDVLETEVILSMGKWSKEKHFNRVCKYAIHRGKDCLNDTRTHNETLTWGYQCKKDMAVLDQEINTFLEKFKEIP